MRGLRKVQDKEYAKACRHSLNGYCYVQRQQLDNISLCPCRSYEERLLCCGCKYTRGGLGYCLEEPFCKRYTCSPAVKTLNNPDKYEAKDDGKREN